MGKEIEYDEIFKKFFYESLDALVLLDIEANRFVLFNDNVLSMYGYTKEEFANITPYELTVEFTSNLKMEHKQENIVTRGWDKFLTKHKTKSGEVLDIYVKSKKIEYKDAQLLYITLTNINSEDRVKSYFYNSNKIENYMQIQDIYKWSHSHEVLIKNDEKVMLSQKEKKVVSLLIKNIDTIVSQKYIINIFTNENMTYNSLLLIIKRIRAKTSHNFIESVYSKGYMIKS